MMCDLVLKMLELAGFAGDAEALIQHCWTGAATQAGKYTVIVVVVLTGLLVRRLWKKLRGQTLQRRPPRINHKRKK
ncbi:hypothetical protein [Pantoea sp.]|uniref:hypothetical protein n=1 Tax=Pantoea sp. TaxID=69393 RepID=UPI0028ADA1BD|nr:hypothetical protein [Pantoea sp.]